jgi:hypothetical protein
VPGARSHFRRASVQRQGLRDDGPLGKPVDRGPRRAKGRPGCVLAAMGPRQIAPWPRLIRVVTGLIGGNSTWSASEPLEATPLTISPNTAAAPRAIKAATKARTTVFLLRFAFHNPCISWRRAPSPHAAPTPSTAWLRPRSPWRFHRTSLYWNTRDASPVVSSSVAVSAAGAAIAAVAGPSIAARPLR